MITMRRNVFETNSSSTHSLTMCMKEDYDRWMSEGNLYLVNKLTNTPGPFPKFVTREELLALLAKEPYAPDLANIDPDEYNEDNDEDDDYKDRESIIDEYLSDYGYYTSATYNSQELEEFDEVYTLPDGQQVIAFGYFGHD